MRNEAALDARALAAPFEGIAAALGGEDVEASFHDDAADIVYEIRWK